MRFTKLKILRHLFLVAFFLGFPLKADLPREVDVVFDDWVPSNDWDVPYAPVGAGLLPLKLFINFSEKLANSRLSPETDPVYYNMTAFKADLAAAKTPEAAREVKFLWLSAMWDTVAEYRAVRLWELESRVDADKRVGDFRFNDNFDRWQKQLKQLRSTQEAFEQHYARWVSFSHLQWYGGWRKEVTAFPNFGAIPRCYIQAARMVYAAGAPAWGYETEVETARKEACPPAVIEAEKALELEVKTAAKRHQLVSDGVALINEAARFLWSLTEKEAKFAREVESCAGDFADPVLCIAKQLAQSRSLQKYVRPTARLVAALNDAQKFFAKSGSVLQPLSQETADWAKRMSNVLADLSQGRERWKQIVGESYDDAYWDQLLEGYSDVGVEIRRLEADSRDAGPGGPNLYYSLPGTGLSVTTPGSSGGAPVAWHDYIRDASKNYKTLKSTNLDSLPKFQKQVQDQTTKFVADWGAGVVAQRPKLAEIDASVVRNLEHHKRTQFREVEDRLKELGLVSKDPLLPKANKVDLADPSLPQLSSFLAGIVPKGFNEGAALRTAAVSSLASAIAAQAGRADEAQAYRDVAWFMGAMASGAVEHKRTLLGLVPGVGWAQDVYESIGGQDVDGNALDWFDRGFATFGALSAGIASKAKLGSRALRMWERAFTNGKSREGMKDAIRVGEKLLAEGVAEAPKLKNVKSQFVISKKMTAEEANEFFKGLNYSKPPVLNGSRAYELVAKEPQQFVRFHKAGKAEGPWMMRWTQVKDKTLEQVAKKFNIPKEITHMTRAEVAPGARLMISRSGVIREDGVSGAVQYFFMGGEIRFFDTKIVGKIIE